MLFVCMWIEVHLVWWLVVHSALIFFVKFDFMKFSWNFFHEKKTVRAPSPKKLHFFKFYITLWWIGGALLNRLMILKLHTNIFISWRSNDQSASTRLLEDSVIVDLPVIWFAIFSPRISVNERIKKLLWIFLKNF